MAKVGSEDASRNLTVVLGPGLKVVGISMQAPDPGRGLYVSWSVTSGQLPLGPLWEGILAACQWSYTSFWVPKN